MLVNSGMIFCQQNAVRYFIEKVSGEFPMKKFYGNFCKIKCRKGLFKRFEKMFGSNS